MLLVRIRYSGSGVAPSLVLQRKMQELDDDAGVPPEPVAHFQPPEGCSDDLEPSCTDRLEPASVLVHGRGSIEDVLLVLKDIEEIASKEGVAAKTSRKFEDKPEFDGLVERVQDGKATVKLRKLFLYSGQCSVMQEIWIQDKQNPDAVEDPLKSYAIVHVHHHWDARVSNRSDIRSEHLKIVDAVNARHMSRTGSGYQVDNPFFNTFIEPSGPHTLKVFPEGWKCNECGRDNLPHHSTCLRQDWWCPNCR